MSSKPTGAKPTGAKPTSVKPTGAKPTTNAALANESVTATSLETQLGIVEKALHEALRTGSIASVARSMKHEIVSH